MAIFEIEKDGKVFEVDAPDQATAIAAFDKAMGNAVQAQQPDVVGRLGETASDTFTGAMQGLTMGSYDELASAIGAPIKGIERLVTGQDQISGMEDILPFLGRSFDAARQGQSAIVDQAYERSPAAAISGDIAGALGLGLLSGGANVAQVARPTIAGMAGRGAVEGGLTGAGSGFNAAENDDLGSRLSSAGTGAVAGALLGGVTGGLVGNSARKAQVASAPSVDDLKADAGMLYDYGRNAGIAASPTQSTQIADDIAAIARKENVILPNGKTNPAYSALNGIMDVVDAYKGRAVPVGEIQTIRDNIRDVVASPEPGVQRIALDMLDKFNDDYAYKVYPELAEADNLYWKAKTGELIETLGKLAGARSGQYTQSGMENALRAEFRALERQIIKGRVKGLPKELVEQISKISQGDSIQDAARWASKFGIQNPLTSLSGGLAGIATGSIYPALGIWGVGQGAKMVAEKMAKDKFAVASALARNGGALPAQDISPLAQALMQSGSNLAGRAAP